MIILDTNVVSELMRQVPDERVIEWVAREKPFDLALSTIAVAEIERGLARLPSGRRRSRLESAFEGFVSESFNGRIFPFDETAARIYGKVAAKREASGLSVDAVDVMVASIAVARGAGVATRNTADFEQCGVPLVNPWRS